MKDDSGKDYVQVFYQNEKLRLASDDKVQLSEFLKLLSFPESFDFSSECGLSGIHQTHQMYKYFAKVFFQVFNSVFLMVFAGIFFLVLLRSLKYNKSILTEIKGVSELTLNMKQLVSEKDDSVDTLVSSIDKNQSDLMEEEEG